MARPLDPLTPLHRVAELPQGELLAPENVAWEWAHIGATLTAASLLGIAARTTEIAVAYARSGSSSTSRSGRSRP